jgi:hypothetical protein
VKKIYGTLFEAKGNRLNKALVFPPYLMWLCRLSLWMATVRVHEAMVAAYAKLVGIRLPQSAESHGAKRYHHIR